MPSVTEADGTSAFLDYYSDAWIQRDLTVPLAEFEAAYTDQLKYVNDRTLEAVDRITRGSPDAVIVVMSDHGTEFGMLPEVMKSDLHDRFSILFATRTPGRPGVFPDDITPVNLFPGLLRTYFDEEVGARPDLQFVSSPLDPRLLEPAPDLSDGG